MYFGTWEDERNRSLSLIFYLHSSPFGSSKEEIPKFLYLQRSSLSAKK